ncbi:acyl-CoA thioesterase [Streptomyces asiaticus]
MVRQLGEPEGKHPGVAGGAVRPEQGVRLAVRHSDLDTNGHVRGSAYVDFADHARWACVQKAGVDPLEMTRSGLGPVNLETTIR